MAKDAKSNQDLFTDSMVTKKERKLEAQKKAQKKSRTNTIVALCVVVVLVLFAALLIFNKCMTNGSTERRTVVASTENFEVSQAMMTYFFNTTYNQYANYYSSDSDSFQNFIDDINSKGSNFTSLMSMVKQEVEQYLTYAEMAKAEGLKLDGDDEDEIDSVIENYKDLKVTYGQSNSSYTVMTFDRFLEVMFGESVNESVVRDCLKLSLLASKYQEEFTEALEYTDEQYETYYSENIDNYRYVDLLKYTFEGPKSNLEDDAVDASADAAEDAGDALDEAAEAVGEAAEAVSDAVDEAVDAVEDAVDEAVDAAEDALDVEANEEADAEETKENEAKANAEALAAKTTPDEFISFMTDYLTKVQEENTAEGEDVDTDAIQTNVDAITSDKQLKSNITDEDAKEWAFAEDTKVGDTKIVEDEEAGTYTVYMLKASPYRDEELTKKAAVIYLTDSKNDGDSETAAAKIKDEWDKGEKSEEAFLALAGKYSESSHNHVEEGYSKNTADIGEWLCEEGRAEGDVGVVHSDSNACTYIVYFAGDGAASWKNSVKSALASNDLSDAVKAFAKEHMVNDNEDSPSIVTFDDAKINAVKPISLSANKS